jgi:uncharacterized membrane protein YeaQ/YmgE (transglycosylase-associated protein family)
MRTTLYGVLGFLIFGIIGILIGSGMYPVNDPNSAGPIGWVALVIAIIGTIFAVWLARWMTTRGERKLENFQNRPQMIWGVLGAVFGGLVIIFLLRVLNPTNADPYGVVLVGIVVGIFLCGWATMHIARLLGLSNTDIMPITTTSTTNPQIKTSWVTHLSNLFIAILFAYFFLQFFHY